MQDRGETESKVKKLNQPLIVTGEQEVNEMENSEQ